MEPSSQKAVPQATSGPKNRGQVKVTNAVGARTTYEYDGFNRRTKTLFPSPSATDTSNASDYEQDGYDAYGRLTTQRKRDGNTFTYGYDNLGRIISIDAPGTQPDKTFAYDNLSRVTSAVLSGNTTGYTYDALSRQLTSTQAGRTVTYTYDLAGRRTSMKWPDNYLVCYNYNLTNELTSITENCPTPGTELVSMTYNNLGLRTSLTRANGSVTGYEYDGAARLIDLALNLGGGTTNDLWVDLDYNPARQITSRVSSNPLFEPASPPTGGSTDSYTPNLLDRYSAATGASPTYDGRGNMTFDGVRSYTYDYDNRMITAGSATLTYDPEGRLYQVAGSTTTQFLYDGADLIGEYVSNVLVRRYIQGAGTDEPLIWIEVATSEKKYLASDERGSIVAIEGSATVFNKYDAYGLPDATNTGRFQYTGQIWVGEIGLYHYKARAYNPKLGRFMQVDPAGYADGMNLYAYVRSDPVNNVDPTGTMTKCDDPFRVCGTREASPDFTWTWDHYFYQPGGPKNGRAGGGDVAGTDGCLAPNKPDVQGVCRKGGSVSEDLTIPTFVIGLSRVQALACLASNALWDRDSQLLSMLASTALYNNSNPNFTLGAVTPMEADRLGRAWVGPGAIEISGGKGLVSLDGSKVYRSPAQKSYGGTVANLERMGTQKGKTNALANGHLNIKPSVKAPLC